MPCFLGICCVIFSFFCVIFLFLLCKYYISLLHMFKIKYIYLSINLSIHPMSSKGEKVIMKLKFTWLSPPTAGMSPAWDSSCSPCACIGCSQFTSTEIRVCFDGLWPVRGVSCSTHPQLGSAPATHDPQLNKEVQKMNGIKFSGTDRIIVVIHFSHSWINTEMFLAHFDLRVAETMKSASWNWILDLWLIHRKSN